MTKKTWLRIALLALAYVLVARFSLAFLVQPEQVATFWPPSGFLLAVLILTPRRRWPVLLPTLFVANTAANVLVGAPVLVSLGYSVANWTGSLCAVWVLTRALGRDLTLGRLKEVLGLFGLVALASNAVTGTLGAAVSALAFGASFWSSWRTWWISDSMGVLVVAPVIVSWARVPRAAWRRVSPARVAEGVALLGMLAALTYVVFHAKNGSLFVLPLPYTTFPFLLWAAVRFGTQGSSMASLVLAGIAIWFTAHGSGPFSYPGETVEYRVLSVQAFLSVATMGALMLAAVIRERQQAQDALRGAYAGLEVRIQERTQELSRSNAELARSNAELEQFAYVASHDLQEPLRAVTGTVQLLQQRYQAQLGSGADELIGHAVEGASRMKDLINDLLAYSRVRSQAQAPKPSDCSALVKVALTNLATAIRESGAVVTCDGLPTLTADPVQMIQLFQNLVGNAIKFRGDRSPEIQVRAEHAGGELRFVVRDNGIGIEPQYHERIFGIFQRLHTRTAYPGNGIGLAICKKIVERHGGRIWVESQAGRGTAFYFTLPGAMPAGERAASNAA